MTDKPAPSFDHFCDICEADPCQCDANRDSAPSVEPASFVSDQVHHGPSCTKCGAIMVFKCLSCGSTASVEPQGVREPEETRFYGMNETELANIEQPIHRQHCAVFEGRACNCGLEWKVPREPRKDLAQFISEELFTANPAAIDAIADMIRPIIARWKLDGLLLII